MNTITITKTIEVRDFADDLAYAQELHKALDVEHEIKTKAFECERDNVISQILAYVTEIVSPLLPIAKDIMSEGRKYGYGSPYITYSGFYDQLYVKFSDTPICPVIAIDCRTKKSYTNDDFKKQVADICENWDAYKNGLDSTMISIMCKYNENLQASNKLLDKNISTLKNFTI